jgi:glucose-6-phosphate 1-dehydrogenase
MSRADVLVLFGATGDLARKKLYPALYQMQERNELGVKVIGVASSRWTQQEFRDNAENAMRKAIDNADDSIINAVLDDISLVIGDYRDDDLYVRMAQELKGFSLPVFYLAIPPMHFDQVVGGLQLQRLTDSGRVVVEKPFGRDYASALHLQQCLSRALTEDQVFRIDHYLGKESVEDLLVFRFANTIFEPVWNRNYIASVQITMAEKFGVEGRGAFYDEVGAVRDVLQNHLLQVLAILAMEPPADLGSQALQDEKVKVLRAVAPLRKQDVVFGQYVGYLDEGGVETGSKTETFAAVRLAVNNWRWAGVPFFLRTGKALADTVLEAVVEFKPTPQQLFAQSGTHTPSPNLLRFRLSAREGVDIELLAKTPGNSLDTTPVDLTVEFEAALGERTEAYERLLAAALEGDHFRFTRIDSVLESWRIVQPILDDPPTVTPYFSGTWGPHESESLLAGFGSWRDGSGQTPKRGPTGAAAADRSDPVRSR